MKRAIDGARTVIFLAGAGGGTGRGVPRDVDFGAAASAAALASDHGVHHYILLSSAAVTQPEHPHNCTFNSVLKWKLRGEDAVRASGVPYTIVRALGLRDRPMGQQGIRIVQGDRIAFGEDIAREDLGCFLADVADLAPDGSTRSARPGRFSDGFVPASLFGATCEIYNDATVAPEQWVSLQSALAPDRVPQGVAA